MAEAGARNENLSADVAGLHNTFMDERNQVGETELSQGVASKEAKTPSETFLQQEKPETTPLTTPQEKPTDGEAETLKDATTTPKNEGPPQPRQIENSEKSSEEKKSENPVPPPPKPVNPPQGGTGTAPRDVGMIFTGMPGAPPMHLQETSLGQSPHQPHPLHGDLTGHLNRQPAPQTHAEHMTANYGRWDADDMRQSSSFREWISRVDAQPPAKRLRETTTDEQPPWRASGSPLNQGYLHRGEASLGQYNPPLASSSDFLSSHRNTGDLPLATANHTVLEAITRLDTVVAGQTAILKLIWETVQNISRNIQASGAPVVATENTFNPGAPPTTGPVRRPPGVLLPPSERPAQPTKSSGLMKWFANQ
eukprot:GHVN01005214.1.p2 GENE.GHVN01005214.1~~GHVN01005214.1.p2  ORF type:complete len:366 (-),score=18.48 GHVN01005214.1:186-1283(-)